jgi:argininosuccinate lyase
LTSAKNRLWDKGESLNEDIHAFTVGNDPEVDLHLVSWDCLASAAHAKMLFSKKLLSKDELNALLKALKKAYDQSRGGSFSIPSHLEDAHTALEVFLTEQCGDAGKKIHTARSRNDQVMVAMRLLIKKMILDHAAELCETTETSLERATDSIRVQMPGYTHFQQAMPASTGMWFASIAESSLSLLREARSLYDIADENPLGAASGFYTPIPIDRDMTTTLLGFKRTQRNPIEIQNSRGRYETRTARLCSDISSLMEKYSSDIILYTMAETGFFSIPREFTTGSSIMPQKRNPDVLELLRAQASRVRACQFELESLTAKLPSNYHRDFQLTKDPLIRASHMTAHGQRIFRQVLKGLEYKKEVLEKSKTPELYATYHAYRLVQKGIPFREAYKQTANDLEAGAIDCNDLQKDFETIALTLDSELALAKKELDTTASFVTTKKNELLALADTLLIS